MHLHPVLTHVHVVRGSNQLKLTELKLEQLDAHECEKVMSEIAKATVYLKRSWLDMVPFTTMR